MKIYLASAFDQRWWLRTIVPVLEERGWTVTSDWVQLTDEDMSGNDDLLIGGTLEEIWAERNFNQLHEADTFLLFVRGHSKGGCWTELGIAIAEGKTCLVVGETKNVFRHLPGVLCVEEAQWVEALDGIRKKDKNAHTHT